ncbi:MAG: Fic family protein, partial [Acidaminococcaceae bacterium]
RKEIKLALDKQGTGSENLRMWRVVNKYSSLLNDDIKDFTTCEDIRQFYDEFILREVIADNPDNAPDGSIFREESVSVCTGTDKIIHQGLYPEQVIIATMNKALDLLHDENIPLLVRVAIFHYLFGYIHPFYDGNGRLIRFITSQYLAKELGGIISIRISITIKKQLKKYYKLFEQTNNELNRGDLTPFIYGFLMFVFDTIKETKQLLLKKMERLGVYKNKLNQLLEKTGNGDKLLNDIYYILLQASLFSGDGATVEQIMDTAKKSRNTIEARLAQMPDGHLIKITDARPYRYKFNVLTLK